MKKLFLAALFVAGPVLADTFNLPEGITFRAKGVGYDCGEFFTDFKTAPEEFAAKNINFVQLAADKDLNAFVSELSYTNDADTCSYGVYWRRDRDTKTLNFERSEIIAQNNSANCADTKEWLDNQLATVIYYASKRGIRFIALELPVVKNNICESGVVRTVFDRR